jgi:hypothetical protein
MAQLNFSRKYLELSQDDTILSLAVDCADRAWVLTENSITVIDGTRLKVVAERIYENEEFTGLCACGIETLLYHQNKISILDESLNLIPLAEFNEGIAYITPLLESTSAHIDHGLCVIAGCQGLLAVYDLNQKKIIVKKDFPEIGSFVFLKSYGRKILAGDNDTLMSFIFTENHELQLIKSSRVQDDFFTFELYGNEIILGGFPTKYLSETKAHILRSVDFFSHKESSRFQPQTFHKALTGPMENDIVPVIASLITQDTLVFSLQEFIYFLNLKTGGLINELGLPVLQNPKHLASLRNGNLIVGDSLNGMVTLVEVKK